MKKIYLTVFLAFSATIVFFSSCSYNPGSTNPPDTTHNSKLTFKKDFHANYDLFVVDTADKNGNNLDNILTNTRIQLQDIVMDTALHYQGKYPVVKINSFQGNMAIAVDSQYFYQDPNGDLYRYNYGFSILNQYTFLTQAIGHPIDVGWVLAAKLASAAGTTWVAKVDTEHIQSPQIDVFLVSQATMKSDTTIIVGTESITARHVQHHISATTPPGINETGDVIIDSYMSANLSNILIDFFRHSTLQGSLSNSKTQGKFKIMTSHQ